MPILLAGLSAIMFGVGDFLGGIVAKRVRTLLVVFWSQLIGLGALVGAALIGGRVSFDGASWAVMAGTAAVFGLSFLYGGLARGRMTVVAPVAGLVGAGLPAFAGFLAGERSSTMAAMGIAAALPAIVLLSSGDLETSLARGGLWHALGAGVGLGLFAVFIAQTPVHSGLWPLVIARISSVVILWSLIILRDEQDLERDMHWAGLTLIGLLDAVATVLFLTALRSGLLMFVAVIVSLYPAVTILVASWILHEPVRAHQRYGMALAGISVMLIAIG